jgi:hypothetical protein
MAIAEPTPTPVRHATLRLHEISEWLEGKSSAYAWQSVGVFIAIVFLVSLVRASRATMWIDELYTYHSSHQPSAASVVNAIRDGCDGAPPAYALIVRALQPVLGGGVMDLRVPAVFGFCLMCVCVFVFVYRRLPALYAGLAMLFACDSVLYFATEGRAYGLVLGLVALSLVCWQMAADGRHRLAALSTFVFCMWVATALHYYSVLLLIPLFAAEIIRWFSTKKIDVPMLAAFALVPLVLIPHIPLLEAQRRFIHYYHSKASLRAMVDFYVHYVGRYSIAFAAPILLCAIFGARAGHRSKRPFTRGAIPAHEWALLIVMAVLPVIVVLASLVTIKTFVDRYMVWTVVGFAALGAAILYRITRGNVLSAAGVVALLLVGFAGASAVGIIRAPRLRESTLVKDELATAPSDPAPIVIANHHVFMELSYYGDPKLRSRLVYVVSPSLERSYTGIDTGDLLLSALARHTSLTIVNYDDFVKRNRRFLLAANAEDWLVWQFSRSGFDVNLMEPHWEPGLFKVEAQASR